MIIAHVYMYTSTKAITINKNYYYTMIYIHVKGSHGRTCL